ncbi:MAG: UDP-N-acetylglucosamine 2-epimerase (non-hydrolyzing) [Acidimicrobiales bacterium]
MVVFGTRPEAIKLAPVVQALAASPDTEPVVVVTAQHRTMLDQVLDFFELRVDIDLDMFAHGQTLTDLSVRALGGLSPVIRDVMPDVLVVQGDTTTTFVAAQAAFYHQVPVAHVEAGLRTNNPLSPFPEEINRRLTTQLTSLHLAPTETAAQNLLREAIDPNSVLVTGNTVIDALEWAADHAPPITLPGLEGLETDPGRFVLVTTHRRESWGEPMARTANALATLADRYPDVRFVVPMHGNPTVRNVLRPALEGKANVVLTEPFSYGDFARALRAAHLVLTDSGGIQEEAPTFGTPVLVLRDTTERPEAIDAGAAKLVGTDAEVIVAEASRLLDDSTAYEQMAQTVNPFGDGRAADRVVGALLATFRSGLFPEPFSPHSS